MDEIHEPARCAPTAMARFIALGLGALMLGGMLLLLLFVLLTQGGGDPPMQKAALFVGVPLALLGSGYLTTASLQELSGPLTPWGRFLFGTATPVPVLVAAAGFALLMQGAQIPPGFAKGLLGVLPWVLAALALAGLGGCCARTGREPGPPEDATG